MTGQRCTSVLQVAAIGTAARCSLRPRTLPLAEGRGGLIAASSPHVRSARRGVAAGVGEIDIPVFRLYRQTRVDCPRRRVAAHRLRSGDCLQDLRCCAVMPMSRPSDAQQRGRLPIRQPGVADRLVAAALVAAEQCSTRKVNQIVFAGRTGRGAMPAGNSERSDALHAAGQIEHGLECANDRMGSVRHLISTGQGGWEIASSRVGRDGAVSQMHGHDQDRRGNGERFLFRDPFQSGPTACHSRRARLITLHALVAAGPAGQ